MKGTSAVISAVHGFLGGRGAGPEEVDHASRLRWAVLRPSAYVETWMDIVGARLPSGGPALVFGRAENPINFVSVQDVAVLIERALGDASMSGQTLDVPGPDNLTMEQLALHLGASKIRRIPRGALRCLAAVLPRWAPAFARQTGAALVMDTTDMAADACALLRRFPDITWHPATEVAKQHRS